MSVEKHDLLHDLPDHRNAIHALKGSDTHFSKLFDEYHSVTHEIHGIETQGVNVSDEYFEELKTKRAHLKDELYSIIVASEQ